MLVRVWGLDRSASPSPEQPMPLWPCDFLSDHDGLIHDMERRLVSFPRQRRERMSPCARARGLPKPHPGQHEAALAKAKGKAKRPETILCQRAPTFTQNIPYRAGLAAKTQTNLNECKLLSSYLNFQEC